MVKEVEIEDWDTKPYFSGSLEERIALKLLKLERPVDVTEVGELISIAGEIVQEVRYYDAERNFINRYKKR